MIAEILIVVIILAIYCYCMVKYIRKTKEAVEKVVDVVFLIIIVVFLIIYYMDRFNLPSLFGINKNIDTQNWLTIITTSIVSIISSAIGGLIAFGIAQNEIRENRRQNSESLRIQNMPMLKYEIKIEKTEYEKINEEYMLITNCIGRESSIYNLRVNIENVGLNNVRKIMVDIESLILKKENRIIGDNNWISIQKNQVIEENRYLVLDRGKKYKFNLKVHYQDIFMNWYFQTLDIICDINKADSSSVTNEKILYKVNDDERIIK